MSQRFLVPQEHLSQASPGEHQGHQEGASGSGTLTAAPPVTANVAVREVVEVPGSKSETDRALVLSAPADGPSTVMEAPESRGCNLMVNVLRALGVNIETSDLDELWIMPPQHFRGAPGGIDCGLAGTVMCFVPPLAALADSLTRSYEDPQATTRPTSGLLDDPRQLGAGIDADSLPFTLVPRPMMSDSEVVTDSFASSQFVSRLLLIGAHLPSGPRLWYAGDLLPPRLHIAMAAEMLCAHDVCIDEPGARSWWVHSGPVLPLDVRAEPDLTSASVFLAVGAATGGCVTVPGWPGSTLQPGARFLDVVERMGCTTAHSGRTMTLSDSGRLRGIDVDLHNASELTPVVAVLVALAEGTTRITGIVRIRGHEIDHLSALITEFRKLGVAVIEHHGGLGIMGGSWGRGSVELFSCADHHMVHFAVIVALDRPGTGADDLAYVLRTIPDFSRLWNRPVIT